MTATTPPPSAAIAYAAAVFDGVARDSETAADYEVPIRCGQAAAALHTLVGTDDTRIPVIADDATSVAAAMRSAISALESLPAHATSKPVREALQHARTAMTLIATRPGR